MIDFKKDTCPDCGVKTGQLHRRGCDVERCPYCGLQMGCDCKGGEVPDDDRIPWSGEWPGVEDCRRLGLYARMVPGRGWVPCEKDDEGAMEDLNSLISQCIWDRPNKCWIKRPQSPL